MSDAREIAMDCLAAVLRRGRRLEDALNDHPGYGRLEARDRAFARLLVATTLRRLGQIDRLIGHCLERPLPAKAAGVTDILRLGLAQLLFIGTPAHAAVDTTVTLAAKHEPAKLKPLVNAVMRRMTREGAGLIATGDAGRLNTPDWLWRSWSKAYGEDTCHAIANAHLSEPPLDITVKDEDGDWAAKLDARRLPTSTLRRALAKPSELPGFSDGAWWVQDAAASLPARLLGDVRGKTVIELCAAPGGKTAQLAAMGADVIALDRSEKRLERLKGNLARLDLEARLVVADALSWRPDAPAEAILLDAPCTGTGTLRRHPDIARTKERGDVERLAARQDELLLAAVAMLAPGGVLVYAVCSLQPEEAEMRVAALLEGGAPVRRENVQSSEIGGLSQAVTEAGDLRTLPCHLADLGGMDGFYAARLRRSG
ncbi:MAG: MFS transporter [Proteobacteria bacterium]|nr:MFS transporter [Pseudomonadota bacterium]